jgi:protease-4
VRRLWRGFLWFFALIGLASVALVVLGVVAALHFRAPRPAVPDTAILKIDLNRSYREGADTDAVMNLVGTPSDSFVRLVTTIHHAALDPRVKGLVARTGDMSLGFAETEELRDAVTAFRAKGKFAYVFAESFGDLGGGTGAYYLASGFDRIWLQPVGSLGLTGIAVEMPFLKGLLDKVGIGTDFSRRGDYKTAETELTGTALLPTDKTALAGMTQSLYDQVVAGIAAGRHLKPDAVKAIIDGGPYMTAEALDAHLIDAVGYRDDMEHAALAEADGSAFISLDRYADAVSAEEPPGRPVVALLRAVGPIVSGSNDGSDLGGTDTVASDDLVKALDQVAHDPKVRAVVLRIDSPGGSQVASETVWHAVRQLRAAGKPVVVSMGDEAASGGYYIAAGADRIVAEPGTLTGSIGVFGGKFVADGLWQKLGVSWDGTQLGQNADIASSNRHFSPAERQRFEAMLDDSYQAFIQRVAEGRHIDPAKAAGLAGGRVWTGAQAKDNGLVDELGGLDKAVDLAGKIAKLPADQPVSLVAYPAPRSLLTTLHAKLDGDDEEASVFPDRGVLARLGRLEMLMRVMATALDPSVEAVAPPLRVTD